MAYKLKFEIHEEYKKVPANASNHVSKHIMSPMPMSSGKSEWLGRSQCSSQRAVQHNAIDLHNSQTACGGLRRNVIVGELNETFNKRERKGGRGCGLAPNEFNVG